MALTIVSANDDDGIEIAQGTELVVLEGVVVSNTGASAPGILVTSDTYNNGFITILGTVIGEDEGVDIFTEVDAINSINNSPLTIGQSGSVFGGDIAIDMENVTTRSPVVNFGTVFGGNIAVSMAFADNGDSGVVDIANHGRMSSGSPDGATILLRENNSGVIQNTGFLANTANGVVIKTDGASDLKLINSGLFSTSGDTAIDASDGDTFMVKNTGEMVGDLLLTDGADMVQNTGLISGDVLFGFGDDTYRGLNDGLVNGLVDGASGDDTLVGSNADDTLSGGDDEDRVVGGSGDDELSGGAQDDIIRGGDGNDLINGDGGEDDVRGGNGADDVRGGSSDDTVRGGSGDDRVDGGSGEDDVRGGAGDDEIVGGRDKDQLFGGAGNDIFIFESALDSTNDSNRDFIKDFELGADLIDLTGLPGTYDFVGSTSLSGTGREVRVTVNSAGNSTIFVDTDGDGTADSRIIVEGVTGLTEADFLL